ncbi:hypothetical protein NDU88_004517 [Pleurodeles waltl]|uniref:Uncharacterized protein n=1 Tax=Pleurodeles waltl TaxID=8319 RepID=A0AAV7TRQ3_PLEWA|nr:hypothetical protein NDU88_004517 [Pleurodeles waltl]
MQCGYRQVHPHTFLPSVTMLVGHLSGASPAVVGHPSGASLAVVGLPSEAGARPAVLGYPFETSARPADEGHPSGAGDVLRHVLLSPGARD